jgi:hypothetical protein
LGPAPKKRTVSSAHIPDFRWRSPQSRELVPLLAYGKHRHRKERCREEHDVGLTCHAARPSAMMLRYDETVGARQPRTSAAHWPKHDGVANRRGRPRFRGGAGRETPVATALLNAVYVQCADASDAADGGHQRYPGRMVSVAGISTMRPLKLAMNADAANRRPWTRINVGLCQGGGEARLWWLG